MYLIFLFGIFNQFRKSSVISVFDWLLQEELSDVNIEHLKRGLVEFLISKALDHKDHHRELTSVLISDLYGKVLTADDVTDGFDDVLSHLSDLVIDTPDATTVGITVCWCVLITFTFLYHLQVLPQCAFLDGLSCEDMLFPHKDLVIKIPAAETVDVSVCIMCW